MLNDKSIRKLVLEKKLISPFSEDLLQSHTYDLTLNNEFILFKACKPHEVFEVGKSNIEDFREKEMVIKDSFIIYPNDFVLGVTIEKIKLPPTLTATLEGKSTVGRLGLLIHDAGFIDAGFEGTLTLEIKNLNSFPIKVIKGMKIAQIIFYSVDEPETAYNSKRNHYQGQITVTQPDTNNLIN